MKILLVQLGRIGDMILLSSGFPAIKKKFPDCELHVLASRHNRAVLNGNPNVDRVIVYDKSFFGFPKFLKELRRESFDFWIDPKDHYSRESSILARLANADYKIGRDSRFKSEWGKADRNRRNPFDYIVPSDEQNIKLHYIERLSNALAPLGAKLDIKRDHPQLFPSQDSISFAEKFLAGRNTIYVNISASSASRTLPVATWIDALRRPTGKEFFAIGAMPREVRQAEEIERALGKDKAELYPARGLEDVIAIISLCGAVVTPDTAPVHIASAFGTPTLAVFFDHEANLNKFRPLAPGSRIIIDSDATEAGFSISPDRLAGELKKIVNR